MKIAICAKRDLVSATALNVLLAGFEGRHSVMIILSDKVNAAERSLPQAQDFVFYERDLAIDLMFSLLDENDQHGELLTFEALAKKYDAPLYVLGNINDEKNVELVKTWQPDLLLSIRYNYIFKQAILDSVKRATLNLHPGLLPHYAGMYAPFHALNHGEPSLGCTLHYIDDEAIDAGEIISTAQYSADRGQSVMHHFEQCYRLGMGLILQAVGEFENNVKPASKKQNLDNKKYFSYPTTEEFNEFSDKGGVLITHGELLSALKKYLPADYTH